MSQSLSFNLIHLVFSTKDRFPWIREEYRNELYSYLAVTVRNLDCECYRVGGIEDHVHLAIRINRTISVADLVREVKSCSSKWLKSKSPELSNFAWQRGYGCFSLSPKELDRLIAYIDKQEEHHAQKSFKDEYRAILTKYGVTWDENYVWD